MQQPLRFKRHSVALAALLVLALPAAALAAEGVEPKTAKVTLSPGDSTTVNKTVHTPEIAPKPDIYFLADTTGSMTPAINNVKANAADILSAVDAEASDPQYGAGDYKDFPHDPKAFNNAAPIGAAAAAQTAIGDWSASGGADGPEGQLLPCTSWRPERPTSGLIPRRSSSGLVTRLATTPSVQRSRARRQTSPRRR